MPWWEVLPKGHREDTSREPGSLRSRIAAEQDQLERDRHSRRL